MKRGDKVKAKENHEFLNVSRRHVGVVKEVEGSDVAVQFRHKTGTTIFQADELKVIK